MNTKITFVVLHILLFKISKTVPNSCVVSITPHRPSSYRLNQTSFNNQLPNNCDCSAVNSHACIRKCCDINYVLQGKVCVQNDSDFSAILQESGVLPAESDKLTFLTGGIKCEHYALNSLEFFIHEDGRLKENGVDELLSYKEFCIDLRNDSLTAFVCFPEEQTLKKADFIYTIGMLVSVPFLLATFIIYALLPSRKVHGNALMCYVICLLGGFVLLALLRLKKYAFSELSCVFVVVPCIFFFVSSFFWMNVMSIDIWWTFSGFGGFKGNRKSSETRRLLIYSAYAWGVPLLGAALIAGLSLSPLVPTESWYNPGVGQGTACWFKSSLQELIYFYGPLIVLTLANVSLFAFTAYKIRRAQKDTAVLRKTDSKKHGDDDAQTFSLYLKLLLVMGLNWTMEVISYIVDWQVGEVPPAVWYITDFCNALYGVLIFFLFCFNKKTWNILKARFKFGSRPVSSGVNTQSTIPESRPLKSC